MTTTTTGPRDLNIKTLVEQLRQGKAIFSTKHGQFPARRAKPHSTPIILRSDPFEDAHVMISDLRSNFPDECNKIAAPINNIYDYFDHHDVHIHGANLVVYVLNEIANENERRMTHVQDFATHWMKSNIDGFPDLFLLSLDIFNAEEKEKYDERFLHDALEMLQAFQGASAKSSSRSQGRPRLAVQTSTLRDSSVASSFKTNPFEGQTNVPTYPNSSLPASATESTPPVMINQAHVKRRNSATFTSGGITPVTVPPTNHLNGPKVGTGIPLMTEMSMPRSMELRHAVQAVPIAMVTEPGTGGTVSEQLATSYEGLEPFPPYFPAYSSNVIDTSLTHLPSRHLSGPLPYQNETPGMIAHVYNVKSLPIPTRQAPYQQGIRPSLFTIPNVNSGPIGHIPRHTSGTQGSYPVYSSNPAHLLPQDPLSGRPSPIPSAHMYPYLPPTIYPIQGDQVPQQQLYNHQGYMAQLPSFSNVKPAEHGDLPLFVPKVRNNQQVQNQHSGRNPQKFHRQSGPLDQSRQIHGNLQTQVKPRQNPRKSFSDDARRAPLIDTIGQRPFSGEYPASRRGSSGESYESYRAHTGIQQQVKVVHHRGSGSRGGSRRSSVSQYTPPNRDPYSHFEHSNRVGEYGGYITVGQQLPGRVESSQLIHQTIEEHRSDGGRPQNGSPTGKVTHSNETSVASLPEEVKGLNSQGAESLEESNEAQTSRPYITQSGMIPEMNRTVQHFDVQHTGTSQMTGPSGTSRLHVASFQHDVSETGDRPRDLRKLWVVAPRMIKEEIECLFRTFGEVISIEGPSYSRKLQHPSEWPSQPFYFVLFSNMTEAATALQCVKTTHLNPNSGSMKVSFAFARDGELDGAQVTSSPAKSSPRAQDALKNQQYGAIVSQYRTQAHANIDGSPTAASDSQNIQTRVPKSDGDRSKQAIPDTKHGIIADNKSGGQKFQNSGNPKTPKSKKGKSKSTPSTPVKQEGTSDLQSQQENAQSRIPKVPAHGKRSGLKEVPVNTDSTDKATKEVSQSDVTIASKTLQTDSTNETASKTESSKSKHHGQEEITFSTLNPNGTSKQGAKGNRTQVNTSDGSPSRKSRNTGSSRKPSKSAPLAEMDPHTAQTDLSSMAPRFTEDQWPTLQPPTISSTKAQQKLPLGTKISDRRPCSTRLESDINVGMANIEISTKDGDEAETKPNQAIANDPTLLSDADKSEVATTELIAVSNIVDTPPGPANNGNDMMSSGTESQVEAKSTPMSVTHSGGASSAASHALTSPPSNSQNEPANSWAEESDKQDAERQRALNDRIAATDKQDHKITDKIPKTAALDLNSSDFETKKTKGTPSLELAPSGTEGAAQSQPPANLKEAVVSSTLDQADIIPRSVVAKAASILGTLGNRNEGRMEGGDTSAGPSTISSFTVKSNAPTKRAKRKQKALTIDVPPRTPSPTATISTVPLPSDSPTMSKFKQRVEEPVRSTSLSVPSPPISTHMKKKNKKVLTPTKGTSKAKRSEKISQEAKRVQSDGSEHTTFDGNSMDGSAIETSLSPEEARRQISTDLVTLDTGATTISITDMSREEFQQSPEGILEIQEQATRTRNYPAPDPSSAVYVAGDLPLGRVPAHKTSRLASDAVITTPPSSPDILKRKDREEAEVAKKRDSKAQSQSHYIVSQPRANEASTLSSDMPPPSVPLSSGVSTVPSLLSQDNSDLTARIWRRTEFVSPFENSTHNETMVLQPRYTPYSEEDSQAFDQSKEKYQMEKVDYMATLSKTVDQLVYNEQGKCRTDVKDTAIDHMRHEGLGIDIEDTSKGQKIFHDDPKGNEIASSTLSTRSSIADSISLPQLTRDSSIVSSASRIIFPDVPDHMPNLLVNICPQELNIPLAGEFNADDLETVTLKAGPPPNQAVPETNDLQGTEKIVATPPRSPLAPEFGSGSISSKFEPDVLKGDLDSDLIAPRRSPVMISFQFNLPDQHAEASRSPPKPPKFEAINYQQPTGQVDSQPESPQSCGLVPQPVSIEPAIVQETAEPNTTIFDLSHPNLSIQPNEPEPIAPPPSSPPKLSEANMAAHTVATAPKGKGHKRDESMSEWSTTSSARRKMYSEAATERPLSPLKRGQLIMSPAQSEAEYVMRKKVKPAKRDDAALWALPRKERPWTSGDE